MDAAGGARHVVSVQGAQVGVVLAEQGEDVPGAAGPVPFAAEDRAEDAAVHAAAAGGELHPGHEVPRAEEAQVEPHGVEVGHLHHGRRVAHEEAVSGGVPHVQAIEPERLGDLGWIEGGVDVRALPEEVEELRDEPFARAATHE